MSDDLVVATAYIAGSRDRLRPLIVMFTVVVVACVVAAAGGALASRGSTVAPAVVHADVVPHLVDVNGFGAVVVKVHGSVHAFLPTDARLDPLAFCPGDASAGMFTTKIWASQFTLDGVKINGPAPRDLDSYRTAVTGRGTTVDTSKVVLGAGYATAPTPRLRWNRYDSLRPDPCPSPSVVDALVR